MRYKPLLILSIFFLFPLESQEIIIPLQTKFILKPTHISFSSSPEVNKEYINSMKDIISFDIKNCGYCHCAEKENAILFVDVKLEPAHLICSLRKKNELAPFFTQKTSLCENVEIDRRAVHNLANDLIFQICGIRGITGEKIYFSKRLINQNKEEKIYESEIWEIEYDGFNQRPVTSEHSYCISPVFFPKKQEAKTPFLYVNYKNGQPKIYINDLHNPSKGRPLLKLRGNQLLPAISKKGDIIAFISDASGTADLFIQLFSSKRGLVGKPIQTFSHKKSVQASPTFSPDGKKIAFVSDMEGTPKIFVIDTPYPGGKPSSKPKCLTKKYKHNTCPAWSHDGTKLAYSAIVSGIRQIMIFDFTKNKEYQLTTGEMHKENPCWAKNNLHLVYNSVGECSDIYIININQKVPVKITSGSGTNHYPVWEQT